MRATVGQSVRLTTDAREVCWWAGGLVGWWAGGLVDWWAARLVGWFVGWGPLGCAACHGCHTRLGRHNSGGARPGHRNRQSQAVLPFVVFSLHSETLTIIGIWSAGGARLVTGQTGGRLRSAAGRWVSLHTATLTRCSTIHYVLLQPNQRPVDITVVDQYSTVSNSSQSTLAN